MRKILFAVLVSVSFFVQAAPSFIEARKWQKEFSLAKDEMFNSDLITRKNEHLKFTKHLIDLSKRAEKLFGEPRTSELAACTIAAIHLHNVWITTAEKVRYGGNANLVFIASTSWSGGEMYYGCLYEMDKLK